EERSECCGGRVRVRTLFLVRLAAHVRHERDLLAANGAWRGVGGVAAGPRPVCGQQVDWFLREYRPATFRPERADGLRATMRYRLTGPAGGESSLPVAHGTCRAERHAPARSAVTLEADAEQLFAAAQARAAPWRSRLAR